MTVAAILAEKGSAVHTAGKDSSVMDVVNLLASKKIGAAVILNEDGSVCGIVSERDIVRDIAKHGSGVLDSPVESCMTANVISSSPHDTINQLMETMSTNRFRHLPVMEGGKLLGLISIGDVVKRKIEQAEREAEDMRSYIATT